MSPTVLQLSCLRCVALLYALFIAEHFGAADNRFPISFSIIFKKDERSLYKKWKNFTSLLLGQYNEIYIIEKIFFTHIVDFRFLSIA